jgi:hypothetical protein
MSTVFTLTAPVTVGDLSNPRTVTALAITSIWFTTTPDLAPGGTGELDITLTETTNGWQETITYRDASVLAFFGQPAPTLPSGATYEDVMSGAVFAKLIADGKLPPGTVATVANASTVTSTTADTSAASTASTPTATATADISATDTTAPTASAS